MNIRAFILCLVIAVVFPKPILTIIPENIRDARLIETAPRHTVTVTSKWSTPINGKTNGYWITFAEPVANTRKVQITSDEWKSVGPGGRLTIAVLPDGRPHTLNSGGSVLFEQAMLVVAVVLWLAATGYVVFAIRTWLRRPSARPGQSAGFN